jgi:Endonuclease/Exonuclease/phosphatase family
MKILSWNLNHRTQMKKIPLKVLSIINKIAPDLIVLNEYVDGDDRISFKLGLREIGFKHISLSRKINRENQVLIASKTIHERGDLDPPSYDESSITNFLHIVLSIFDIEVVGIRVPAYKTSLELKAYWSELLDIINFTKTRKIVFIGDFNCDPDFSKTPGARVLNVLRKEGWKIPAPVGEWSYISYNGLRTSCLDYALGSPEIDNISGQYISKLGSHIIAGVKEQDPISDHAILLSEINHNKRVKE